MPRLRQNIVTGEWIIVSPERAKRPDEYGIRPFSSELLHDQKCNFCVGGLAWETRVKDAGSKHVYVIPNKFPAFSPIINLEETGHNFYSDNASVGAHDIFVMENPHDALNHMSVERLSDLLNVMAQRVKYYEKDTGLQAIIPIYNHGHQAGASVAHPHAQLFASPIVPPRLGREFFGSDHYYNAHHHCLFCRMIKHELKENVRIIHKSDNAIAFTAYAPRFPFEVHIVPTHHTHSFSHANTATLQGVAKALHFAVHQLDKKLHHPSLNWFIHSARFLDHQRNPSYHWHIEITPRLGSYGGYELASDLIIETVLPEVAADFLRH